MPVVLTHVQQVLLKAFNTDKKLFKQINYPTSYPWGRCRGGYHQAHWTGGGWRGWGL